MEKRLSLCSPLSLLSVKATPTYSRELDNVHGSAHVENQRETLKFSIGEVHCPLIICRLLLWAEIECCC